MNELERTDKIEYMEINWCLDKGNVDWFSGGLKFKRFLEF
jgi:hypothetical protein